MYKIQIKENNQFGYSKTINDKSTAIKECKKLKKNNPDAEIILCEIEDERIINNLMVF